ncbi:hypothetical protein [Tessaracoccus sp. O5.2]
MVSCDESSCRQPNEEHWHGATADRFMAHVAIHEADDQGETVSRA